MTAEDGASPPSPQQQPPPSRLPWRPWLAALAVAGAVALAVAAAWPRPARLGAPFTPPAFLELEFAEGAGRASDVQTVQGRITASRPVSMVFRWLEEPLEAAVLGPRGALELRLGDGPDAPLVRVEDAGARLERGGETGGPVAFGDRPPREVAIAWSEGAYRLLVDGEEAGRPIEGPAPSGQARVALSPGASLEGLRCSTAGGEVRRLEADPPPPGWRRTLWAGAVALVGAASAIAWARAIGRRRAGWAARLAGAASAAVLVVGLPLAVERQNQARLADLPACEQEPLALPQPRLVAPGRPFVLGERTDGDFRLTAQVELEEGAALDLLLRAELPRIDRQILVTLSADADLPSGVGRNLGLFLETEPAPAALARLPSGRPLRLEVLCRGPRTEAFVDGRPLGSMRDLDLRTGRTAFHVLAGRATVSALTVEPLGQPQPPRTLLRLAQAVAAVAVGAGLLVLAGLARAGWLALLWIWPLAALVFPVAPEGAAPPLLALAAALLAPVPARGRRLAGWAAGGLLVLAVTARALHERPSVITSGLLTALQPQDVAGDPIPERYVWARHPLSRRFNGYLRQQSFRDRNVSLEPPPRGLRIVALGSSSTYGYGVTPGQAWSAQLERLLGEAHAGRRVEVLNAGVPAATAESLRSFLSGVLLPLRPDVVVVSLAFNDHSLGAKVDGREHFATMVARGIGPLERALRQLAAERRFADYQRYSAARRAGEAVDDAEVARHSLEPARRFGESLRAMGEACRAAGVAFVLVQEPHRPGEPIELMAPYHDAMAAVAKDLGAALVSPQAAMDAAGKGAYLDMVHPNAAGHRSFARALLPALLELLPPSAAPAAR